MVVVVGCRHLLKLFVRGEVRLLSITHSDLMSFVGAVAGPHKCVHAIEPRVQSSVLDRELRNQISLAGSLAEPVVLADGELRLLEGRIPLVSVKRCWWRG